MSPEVIKEVSSNVRERAVFVDTEIEELSVTEQCKLLGISRTAYYYQCRQDEEDRDVAVLQLILEVMRELPFYGYRKVSRQPISDHPHMTRKRVRSIMRRFGLSA